MILNKPSLAKPIEGDRISVNGLYPFAEETGVEDVFFAGKGLNRRSRVDVFDDTDIGRYPLVGVSVGITFVFTW